MLSLKKLFWQPLPKEVKNFYHLLTAIAAVAYYRYPARRLKVIGVTGTDGKSTTCSLIYHILKSTGKQVGLITTVETRIGNKRHKTPLHVTTPNPFVLQKLLHSMVDCGCEYAVLETTSHGLDQHRVFGCNFKIGVLTNVTHEHLDYHGTYEKYLAAKAKLFRKSKAAILNADDGSFRYLNDPARFALRSKAGGQCLMPNAQLLTYAIKSEADVRASGIKMALEGMSFRIDSEHFETSLVGEYNVYNILAAVAAGRALGIDRETVKAAIKSFKPLPGRFEMVDGGQDFKVIIDFAHTSNALKNLLMTVKDLTAQLPNCPTAKLIIVFGCTGERDESKRPVMGEVAAKFADLIILTSEDSYLEDPSKIIAEIEKGVRKGGKVLDQNYWKVPERKKAIEFAISLAKKGDIVLITGMGHEETINIGGKEIPWSDREAAEEALRARRHSELVSESQTP